MRSFTPSAAGLLAAALLAAKPVDAIPVSRWAEQERFVAAESGSPYPGRWRNDRVPYLVEVMDCLGLDHPAQEVAIMGSAQSAKSEAGVNMIGSVICQEPSPILVVLPSLDEAKKYNAVKLQTTIDETPALRQRIFGLVSRDEQGSTTFFKRFRGGFLVVTTASSSKGLQMISARIRLYEEISGYLPDVDGRGAPIDQAESRAKAWSLRGGKAVYISTPGEKGSCAISARYETSDQRRFYVPCPHCGTFQVLSWANIKWESDQAPHGAHFVCARHGCVIEESHKPAMIAAGVWIKTYPGTDADPAPEETLAAEEVDRWRARPSAGRYPGFHIWQAYSPFVPWDATVAEYHAALSRGPVGMKAFWQQALGLPWETQGEAPPVDRLLERREPSSGRRVPPGVLFLTGATDVQGDRLEWAVYGWDRHLGGCLVDVGVIAGDPAGEDVWRRHDELLQGGWRDPWGKMRHVDIWGVDAGYLSQRVYAYVARHASSGRVRALDGRPGWKLPAIGTPKTVDVDYQGRKVGAVQLWPVGTWDLKAALYAKLQLTIGGPDETGAWPAGVLRFPEICDRNFFEQLTAEYLIDRQTRAGYVVREWRKGQARNEQHDLAVYNLALATNEAAGLLPEDWDRLAAERHGPEAAPQLDMLAAGPLQARVSEPTPRHEQPHLPPDTPTAWLPPTSSDWLDR